MNVDVMVNGRPWKVAIDPASEPGHVTVTIKGKSRVVAASWIDAATLSLIDGGRVHDVRLDRRGDNGAVGVEVGGKVFEVAVSKQKKNGETVAAGAYGGSHSVKSPMPGRVVRVLVGVGDRVLARQGVVVVEAMKMENELRTPRDGTVTEIAATAGAAVETGAVLVVISD